MMENLYPKSVDFFLGTTTPAGFRGYFEELRREPGTQMYLVKSGPGCGKSTLMKRLAQMSGGPVQCIHCSSDPDSLDGARKRPPLWTPPPPTPWSPPPPAPTRLW